MACVLLLGRELFDLDLPEPMVSGGVGAAATGRLASAGA